ncbi:hypothetical protein BKA70DRAFT_1402949 [Coprinopsis sp. MPI-PUGE-AT-0042]|nr:hypothetical protein BKA70DRAFT_1402949 [Coprinopsis sp. MPI-PUGE-AT-0042]
MASRVPARSYGRQAKAKSPPNLRKQEQPPNKSSTKISEMLVDFQREAEKRESRNRAPFGAKRQALVRRQMKTSNDEPIARKTRTWTQYRREPSESSSCPTDDSDDPPREATTKSRAKGDWNTKPDTSPCTACQTAGIHCFRHIKYNPAAARAKVGPGPAYSSCQVMQKSGKKVVRVPNPGPQDPPKSERNHIRRQLRERECDWRSHTRTIVEDVTLSADPTATLHALTAELLSLRNEMRSLKAEVGAWRGDAGL